MHSANGAALSPRRRRRCAPPEEAARPGHLAQGQVPLAADVKVGHAHEALLREVAHRPVDRVVERRNHCTCARRRHAQRRRAPCASAAPTRARHPRHRHHKTAGTAVQARARVRRMPEPPAAREGVAQACAANTHTPSNETARARSGLCLLTQTTGPDSVHCSSQGRTTAPVSCGRGVPQQRGGSAESELRTDGAGPPPPRGSARVIACSRSQTSLAQAQEMARRVCAAPRGGARGCALERE